MTQLIKPERIPISKLDGINEKSIQQIIADDPSIIGLGELVLKDKERIQPRAGRLDLLMQDPDTNRRYEVEIQLGKTDESHIIRTIEYWDIEKKRYPQYDHCAVLIAEDITSRFLNVIGLFNGFIPVIAIQMNAYRIGNEVGLVFTKVLDEMPLGLVEEDEEIQEMLPGSKNTVKMGIGVQQNREQEYSKNGNKNTVISINIINQGLHCIINKKQDCDGLKNKITYHYVSRDSQAS